jgi:hypothetical protein
MASINETKKPKKGRPTVDSEPVNLRLPRELLVALEEYRRGMPSIPTRPEAIRQLMVEHLKAKGFLRDEPAQ